MQLGHYLDLLVRSERELADAFTSVGEAHSDEADVAHLTKRLAAQCTQHADALQPFLGGYRQQVGDDEPERLHGTLFDGPRTGSLALLRDLHDLYLMASACDITWTLVGQAARSLRDTELEAVVATAQPETALQLQWLTTRMKQAAPQTLVVS
jgi:hypothetical protein